MAPSYAAAPSPGFLKFSHGLLPDFGVLTPVLSVAYAVDRKFNRSWIKDIRGPDNPPWIFGVEAIDKVMLGHFRRLPAIGHRWHFRVKNLAMSKDVFRILWERVSAEGTAWGELHLER